LTVAVDFADRWATAVHLYDRALTTAEVADLHTSGR
jgi:hypothetical protein